MPYINQEAREKLDPKINALIREAERVVEGQFDGDPEAMKGLDHYVLTRFLLNTLKPDGGWHYADLVDVLGTLTACHDEIYHRLVRPYENLAIRKNGDLEEFKDFPIPKSTGCSCGPLR
jgi:hypothetical protein